MGAVARVTTKGETIMSRKSEKAEYKADALAHLRKSLRRGATIYTSCSHVARSGMSRRLHCYFVRKGEIRDITGYVALVLGYRRNDRDDGFTVGGCGMDMGFHVVHSLSYALHGTHDDPRWKGLRHEARPGVIRPGYTLNHRWL